MSKRQFLSVNMRRRNAAMHSLLETNTEDDVLFVQEPWFDRIGVERSDNAREGVDVHGGANHPDWELFYPYFTNDKRAKVMTYKRKQVANHITPLKVVPRLDLAKHPTILVTFHIGLTYWTHDCCLLRTYVSPLSLSAVSSHVLVSLLILGPV
jgi:hypothetical protein